MEEKRLDVTQSPTPPTAAGTPPGPKPKSVGPAVVVGTALEFFDFYLYASMAALVFGPIFFPSESSAVSTLAAFSTFAVGFLVRPLGGIVFGILGDKIGRKAVLTFTLLLMGVATGLIGLIPSYETIGIAAPILLIVFRLLQGFGAGAEFGSAVAMSYEHADSKSRGRQGAWPALGVNIGLLASSLAVTAVTSLSDEALHSWGWRVPFLFSFILVGLGYWMRRNLPETPEFEQLAADAQTRKKVQPLRNLLKNHWRGLTVVAVSTIGLNSISYIFKTFSLSYLAEFRDVAANVGAFGISLASAVAIVIVPLAGRFCDAAGARRVMLIGAGGIAVLAFPFFWLLDTDRPIYIWAALILTVGIVQPTLLAASGSFLAQQFPADVRTSGLGAGREVSGAFAGGLAPLAALTMVTLSPTHSTWGVSIIFVAGAVFIAGSALGDQYRNVANGDRIDDPQQRQHATTP
ncbi:MFS transporter [Rhodococcus koreensis]|jgi:MFS family permease|uniref:Putative proline/betaine transporter n=1 Tax=Rhodococcus koreensis TaxID=99653 RepID=A0A1H4I735_9NOCA|nr:MFS transporter [Rhodococcus koreensis]SEB29710.1 Major Facilitator Superfamily protein [Rhodococcus koreensis]